MSDGPTIYQGLLERDVEAPIVKQLREQIRSQFEFSAGEIAADLAEAIRKAYVAGIATGFQQGVEFEADRAKERVNG